MILHSHLNVCCYECVYSGFVIDRHPERVLKVSSGKSLGFSMSVRYYVHTFIRQILVVQIRPASMQYRSYDVTRYVVLTSEDLDLSLLTTEGHSCSVDNYTNKFLLNFTEIYYFQQLI